MYKVFCDGHLIYDYHLEEYAIFNPKLELELNKTGSFTFTIYDNHPCFKDSSFGGFNKLTSIIEVYQGGYLIFKGRVLNEQNGFYNERQVTCEGELAFLLDSIIRPYEFTGTPQAYLSKIINEHNSQVDEFKRFKVGTVTVTDNDTSNTNNQITRSDSDYKNAWELVQNKLVNSLGGYLWVRHEADGTYIDYLKDFDILSNQKIELGKNLLGLSKIIKGEDVFTAVIPLGASDSGESRLTIKEVNNGLDYIVKEELVEQYGKIFKVVIWDDVTKATNLKNKAIQYLNESKLMTTIELTAADLAGIEDVNPFRLGRYVTVKSKIHGLDTNNDFLVKKLSLDILNPSNNKLTVGASFETLTQVSTGSGLKVTERVEKIEKKIADNPTNTDINEKLMEVTQQTSASINQSSTEIIQQVSNDYFLKEDAEQLVESVNTRFSQTNEEFEFRFNEFSQNLQDVQNGTDAQFQDISKYVKFVDGNIVLGQDGNQLTLKIQNDRISFLEGDVEVAYFSNRKLYVNDGEYINSLKIGKFALLPRANGNLSFKRVG